MFSTSTNTVVYGTKYVSITYYVTPVNNTNGSVSYNTTLLTTITSTSLTVPSSQNLKNVTIIIHKTVSRTTTVTSTKQKNETGSLEGGNTTTSSIPYFYFTFNFNSLINFFRNIIIFVAIFSSLLLILLYIRSLKSKGTMDEYIGEEVLNERSLKEEEKEQKFRKEKIITEYLKISGELETIGANPDFSLTPLEFEKESKTVIKNKQFAIITYFYEVVRFSSLSITYNDLELFNKAIHEIYKEIDTFKSLNDNI